MKSLLCHNLNIKMLEFHLLRQCSFFSSQTIKLMQIKLSGYMISTLTTVTRWQEKPFAWRLSLQNKLLQEFGMKKEKLQERWYSSFHLEQKNYLYLVCRFFLTPKCSKFYWRKSFVLIFGGLCNSLRLWFLHTGVVKTTFSPPVFH